MYDMGQQPQRASPNANMLHFVAIFFVHSHVLPLHTPSSLPPLFFYPSPPISSRLSRTPRRWTSNLAIADRTHSASYKQTSANIFILYLCVRQSRLAGRTDGRTHNVLDLSLHLSVCPFVLTSVTNLSTLYFDNEWTDFNTNCTSGHRS